MSPETGPIEWKIVYEDTGVEIVSRRRREYTRKIGEAAQSVARSETGIKSQDKWMMSSPEGQSCAVEIPAKA